MPGGSKTLKLDGLLPSLEENNVYEDVVPRAIAKLAEDGLPLLKQPMRNGKPLVPRLPEAPDGSPTLATLDLDGLTKLSAEFLGYFDYAHSQLVVRKSDIEAIKDNLESVGAKLLLAMDPPESTKQTRLKVDNRYTSIKRRLLEKKIEANLIEVLISSSDRAMKLISRELTARTSELEKIKQSSNMGRRRKGPSNGIPGGRRVG